MKKCKRCGIDKNIQEYGNNKNNIDGKLIYCKECEKLRGIEYRKKNNDKVRESSKKWRENNTENYKKTIEKYLEKNPNMISSQRIKIYRKNENFRKRENEKRKIYYKKKKVRRIL